MTARHIIIKSFSTSDGAVTGKIHVTLRGAMREAADHSPETRETEFLLSPSGLGIQLQRLGLQLPCGFDP